MRPGETSIGGSGNAFPSTHWRTILSAGDASQPTRIAALEQLLRTYWKPVYAYIRASRRKNVEDAKDLTQAFFAHLLESDTISRATPVLGSFRSYLKGALRYFLIDADRSALTRRPPGGLISLDAMAEDYDRIVPESHEETGEQACDREWFRVLFGDSVRALESILLTEGKGQYFEVFRLYCLEPVGKAAAPEEIGDPDGPTYGEVADRLGLRESDIRNYLSYCRRRIREILWLRIREYCTSDEEAEAEFKEVIGS
jgi:RNA polymerase sigma-70 factor (ECF subfamily)